MGLKAVYTLTCDGCKKSKVTATKSPGYNNVSKVDEGSWFSEWTVDIDQWSAAIPDGWLQIPKDNITGETYLFFHNEKCLKKWLKKQNRKLDWNDFENPVYM